MKPGSKPSWLGCSLQNLATRFTQESSLEPPRICAGIAAEAHRLRQSCLDSTSPDDDAAAKSVCGIMDQNRVEKHPYRMKLTPTCLLSFNTLWVSSLCTYVNLSYLVNWSETAWNIVRSWTRKMTEKPNSDFISISCSTHSFISGMSFEYKSLCSKRTSLRCCHKNNFYAPAVTSSLER